MRIILVYNMFAHHRSPKTTKPTSSAITTELAGIVEDVGFFQ